MIKFNYIIHILLTPPLEESDSWTKLYEAEAVIGEDFIDRSYALNNMYNVSLAFKEGKITSEELFKLENFSPRYFKEAKKVNNDKKEKQKIVNIK